MRKRFFRLAALILGALAIPALAWRVIQTSAPERFRPDLFGRQPARTHVAPKAPDGFLEAKLSFDTFKGAHAMLPIEAVHRDVVPFPETKIIDNPGVLERFPVSEKRIMRP